MDTLWFEVAVVSSMFAFGHIFFGHFEERTPRWRKALKLVAFIALVTGPFPCSSGGHGHLDSWG
jgi:hypothetical protein